MAFNYNSGLEAGETLNENTSSSTRQPAAGVHQARIRSIIHLGKCPVTDLVTKKFKGNYHKAVVVFELMEDDDYEEDGVTRLTVAKDITISSGKKAALTILINTFVKDDGMPAGDYNELIGCSGNIELVKRDKYTNCKNWSEGGISAMHPKMRAMLPDLSENGVGNVKFSEITPKALREMHPWNHVADILMKSESYEGSAAEAAVAKIRETQPEYAIKKARQQQQDAPKPQAAQSMIDLDDDIPF